MRFLVVSVVLLIPVLAFAGEAVAPRSLAEQKELLKAPGAIDELKIYAVDEACFANQVMTPQQGKWPAGLGVEVLKEGKINYRSVTLSGPAPAPFAEFARFLEKLIPKKRKLGYGLQVVGDTVYGPRAMCLITPFVLGEGDIGRIVNKQNPALDNESYRLGILRTGLAKLRKLPKSVVRVVVVYGEDLILMPIGLPALRTQKDMAVFEVMRFETAK